MDTRLKASPRLKAGQGRFFKFFNHQSAAGASLRGRRRSSYLNTNTGYRAIVTTNSYRK